jgi:hypothetical protein
MMLARARAAADAAQWRKSLGDSLDRIGYFE